MAGILQGICWLGALFICFQIGGSTLSLPENFTFPVTILVWGLALFIGGFCLYAGLMAGAGALVPNMKEAGSANLIVLMPMFLGYIVGLMSPMSEAANATLPTILSIFPLTAPVVMIMRLSDSVVPLWQLLLSVGLTCAAAYLTLRAVSAMFHAQNLLSGQPFSLRRYIRTLLTG
jgi:ABC-2 type transport system permease protein